MSDKPTAEVWVVWWGEPWMPLRRYEVRIDHLTSTLPEKEEGK